MVKKAVVKKAVVNKAPSRFAHTLVTPQSTGRGKNVQLVDWARQQLGPIPRLTNKDGVIPLSQVIGADGETAITAANAIRFHLTGDTGRVQGQAAEAVSNCMSEDYDPRNPGASPACFIHLGDVIYGMHKDNLYRDEFYRPYAHYPGKIIAIPGNHDGEIFAGTDPKSLAAFQTNFCAPDGSTPQAAAGARILRQTVQQPGVYWWLQAPFLDVIGLYSNLAEGPGFLEGGSAAKPDTSQIDWFQATLKTIVTARKKSRKGLVFLTHHPPYSNGGGHSGSPAMLDEMDKACKQASIWPDMVISGHAHSYQRHTRTVKENGASRKIPYLVAGCGGRGLQAVSVANGQQIMPGVTFDKGIKEYGYVLLEATKAQVDTQFFQVSEQTGNRQLADSASVSYS